MIKKSNNKKDEIVPVKKKTTTKDEEKKEELSNNEKKFKINISKTSLIILCAIILVFGGCTYYFFGKLLSLFATLGFIFVLFIGYLLDKPKKKGKRKKIIKIILILILASTIVVLLAGCGFLYYVVSNAPDFKQELLKEKEASILYDSEGKQFAKLGSEVRENIEYDQISEAFIDALIATEDSRYFQHSGFDLMRFAKAAFGQALGQDSAGGGSTLTMQLSKNTFTDTNDKGFAGIVRKFTDIYISIFQIERNYTKEQIIEFYVNNHNLSGIIFGVQEASRHFFNKDAKDLTLPEAAIIAGMYQAPSAYNPFNHPQAATKRRKNVLYYMEKHGYITKEERSYAESIPIDSLLTDSTKSTNIYQGYIDLVCKEVQEKYGVDPYTVPMLVYTNMLRSNQDGINNIMNNVWTGKFHWKDDYMQGGIAVIDSTSGKILAVGAGRNRTGAKSYSYATDINRQIGSSAKPLFDYGPGMEYNNWSTYTLFKDEPYTYSNGKKINNFDGRYYHGKNGDGLLTLREALSNSYNVPALKAFQSVDNKKIIELVTSVGITPEINNGYIHEAHAIGAFTGSNPLSMAGAYQMFGNGGYYYEPYSVSKIVFRDSSNGDPIEKTSAKTRVISDSTAYMITDVLRDAVGWQMREGVSDIFAVKTGTTNVDSDTKRAKGLPANIIRDYWIMGYTHNVVIGIWLGYDEISSEYYLDFGRDGEYRNRLLNEAAKVSFKHDGVNFTRPGTVVQSSVEFGTDPPKLPSSDTPSDQIRTEYFKRGTEPSEVSTRYLGADAPTGLTFKSTPTTVTLSWNKVKDPEYIDNATFGYQIYFNPEGTADWYLLGFTTSLTFKFNGTANGKTFDSLYGTYHVHAAYEGTIDSRGKPAEYVYKKDNYVLSVDERDVSFNVGENIPAKYYDGSLISIMNNGYNISFTKEVITIKNKNNEIVKSVNSIKEDTFTVNYKISFTLNGEKITEECSNIIRIKAAPQSNPEDENNNNNNNDNNNSNDNNDNNDNNDSSNNSNTNNNENDSNTQNDDGN